MTISVKENLMSPQKITTTEIMKVLVLIQQVLNLLKVVITTKRAVIKVMKARIIRRIFFLTIFNPFGELNRLIRTITPNRTDENRIERRQEIQQRYTFGNNWVLDENSENESESDGTTLRFERTIAVSIDAPNAELLSQDQFLRLQEIFEEAFDFQNFVTNFSQSFSRIDQILENELGNMSINAQNRQVPTQEAIDELPQVTLSKRH